MHDCHEYDTSILDAMQVDPLMAQRMATWVTWAVINTHRRLEEYRHSQQSKEWTQLHVPDNADVSVLVLGRGVMGTASALALHQLGLLF
jgi:glyoxylate/hydroxypyruvate reductase